MSPTPTVDTTRDQERVWLITGTSTGLGRALAEAVLTRGDRVAATARDPRTLNDLTGPPQTSPDAMLRLGLGLDVTDPAQVTRAVEDAIDHFGRIDVLVNNAGHGLLGALEELTDEQVRAVLDTNVLGVLAVTRAVLPHMRARRRGHIVALSSVGGVVANPGHGLYGASKFALEGLSEALAGEVAPWGIRVSIVEPGPFRTDFAGRSMRFASPIDDYRDTPAGRLRETFRAQDGTQPGDPARAAEAIVAAVHDENAPLRLPLGPAAFDRIRDKLHRQLADLDTWEPTGRDTEYPAP